MAVAIAVMTFWLGAFFVLLVEAAIFYIWFASKRVIKHQNLPEVKTKPPQVVEELIQHIAEKGSGPEESCQFLNIALSFWFQEMRDSAIVKRFVMRRVQKEFEDFMMTRTQGKLVEQLVVRDYSLGEQLPVFHSVKLTDVKYDQGSSVIKSMDISLDVEYKGGAQMRIDADLVLGRCAFVSVKVCYVKGQGRLRFTRDGCTSWSFSFYETPELQVEVECHLDGKQFNQLSSFIENQIHKWVKKKHTLPHYKIRFQPFFTQPAPQDQRVELFVHDSDLTVGQLTVEVVNCSRLPPVYHPSQLFCSLKLAGQPCQPLPGMWRMLWPVVECEVARPLDGEAIGVNFADTSWKEREDERHELVVAVTLSPHTSAAIAGICKGDVLCSINHMKVTSAKSVVKLLHKISTEKFLFTLMRPPSYAQSELLGNAREQKKRHKHYHRDTNTTLSPSHGQRKPFKSHSKHEEKLRHLPISGDFDPNLPPECYVDNYDGKGVKNDAKLDLRRHYCSVSDLNDRATDPKSSGQTDVMLTRSASLFPAVRLPDSAELDIVRASSPGMDQTDLMDQPSSNPDLCTTSLKPASQNPRWDEKFTFNVTPEHQYLNVMVWCHMEDGKGLALSQASISLTDVALQCLSTSLCTHSQRYVLLPVEPVKFGSSRSVIRVSGSRGNIVYEGVYGGDVLLRLTHTTEHHQPPEMADPQPNNTTTPELDQLSDHQAISDCSDNEDMPVAFNGEHKLLQNEPAEKLMTDHDFKPTEIKHGPAYCVICSKKFWSHKVLKCLHCHLMCHKRCSQYCLRQVPCRRVTSGYSIEKDHVTDDHVTDDHVADDHVAAAVVVDKMDDHDFERSITSADFLSDGSETDLSEYEYPHGPVRSESVNSFDEPHEADKQLKYELVYSFDEPHKTEEQLRHEMKTILQEIDSINTAYNAIGRTSPTTEQEEESIKATQENLSVKLEELKSQLSQCHTDLQLIEELNKLDDDT
ncbi:PDZ domain-containing protein 8-like isoform X2 [Dysidea avara]|uniref:PDZ domain-containing protein 8-like isoform X2 n=1 Tax=Dysidea avara TaxID=196820 RepID=UPI00332C67E9